MRALSVVLLLAAAAAPALAQTPPPPVIGPQPAPEGGAEAPAADAAAPAPMPVTPPAMIKPVAPLDEAPVQDEPELPPRRYGYRWQIATADATAIAMSVLVDRVSADGGERPGALATITIASYFFAAPLVHGVHRQGKRALASFAMRAGLPLLLGYLGEKLDGTEDCSFCEDTSRSPGKILGLTVGVLISMAVDTALLTRPIYKRTERAPRSAGRGASAGRARAVLAPALQGVPGGATAGVAGMF